jgi:hypothetical protein
MLSLDNEKKAGPSDGEKPTTPIVQLQIVAADVDQSVNSARRLTIARQAKAATKLAA